MERIELKPCPFCGGVVCKMTRPYGDESIWVKCETCGSSSAEWENVRKAKKAWNTRTPNPDTVNLVKRLRDALKYLNENRTGLCNVLSEIEAANEWLVSHE